MPRLPDRAFCFRCADRMAYAIHVETEGLTVHGTEFACVEVFARCSNCGDEIYIPEINDLNVELREGAYAKATSRPHGRWARGVCTNCRFDLRELTDGENDLEQWVWDEGLDHCSNCGAKMIKEE